MAALTLSDHLETLQQDPDNNEAFEGLQRLVAEGDAQQLGDDPVRAIEAARAFHERRFNHRAASWLIRIEAELVADDPPLAAALWKELGRIRHEELLDDQGAIDAYRRAFELRPDDDELMEAADQLEQAVDSWRQIADRFVQEARSASDATLKSSLLARAGSLVWQHKKRGRAKEVDKLFREALEADPADTRAARLYAETLRARQRWQDAANVVFEAAGYASTTDEQLALYLHAARLWAHRVEASDKAAPCYQRVLEIEPSQPEALGYLVEHYTAREQWDELVQLYERALQGRQRLDDEEGILLQLAMVHWRMRGSPQEAEPYFDKLRATNPAHPGMLDFYREQLQSSPQRLVTILSDAQRATTDATQTLELSVKLGRIAQQDDQMLERAVDAWKSVLRSEPHHEEAREALKALYRRTEKWNSLIELLKEDVKSLPEDARDRRLELLREMVSIYRDQLHIDAMVIGTYNAILEDAPQDREALEQLARIYESMGRWNDLIQVLTRLADIQTDDAAKVELYTKVADIWIERFANYNQATRPLERVVEIDPENRDALSRLKEIYTKKRAWQSLYEVLRKEVELTTDPQERLEGKVELAKLAGERLHRHADAIALWREVVQQEPRTEGAVQALEKLAEREKEWPTLAEALERRLEQTEDEQTRVKILQKLGSVYGDQLGDHTNAVSAWRRVLEVDPKNGRALRALRESFLAARDWEGLEALYAEAADWEGLVDVLGSAAERADDPQLKIDLSFRAAEIYEQRIGEPHRAFRNYERVLFVDPHNVRAARALVPIYEKDEKWSRLAGLLEVLLAAADEDDADEQVSLLQRLRELAANQLRDHRRAFDYAARAYRLSPHDPDVVEGLERAAQSAGARESLVSLYRERLEQASADEAIGLRRRIANLLRPLGRTEEAIEHLRAVFEAEPEDTDVATQLEQLYRSQDRVEELRDLQARRAEHSVNERERGELLRELASLEEQRLNDPKAAATRYRALLEIDPSDREALAALDRIATEQGHWQELVDILQQRRDLSDNEAEQLEFTLRLSALYLDQLDDPQAALSGYREVMERQPANETAISGLERVAKASPELAGEAQELLEHAYEARGSHGELAEVLRKRLEQAQDAQERRDLRLRLADLMANQLGNLEEGYRAVEAAFLDDPEDLELWDRLTQTAEHAGKHEDLARSFARALDSGLLDTARIPELAARVAEIYDNTLGRPEDAAPFHRKVLEHEPLDDRAFGALKDLYTNTERWDELQALYRNRIAETYDGDAKLELLLQVCFLWEEILDDPEQAIRAYQEALELDPEHAGAHRALERLYRRTARWHDLAELLRSELERAEGHEIIELALELGELYEKSLDDPSAAVDQYERVLEQSPTQLRAQEALERLLSDPSQRQRVASILEPLYEGQGAWAELARVLQVQLEAVQDPGEQVALLSRAAELYESKLDDAARAFDALARAVEADPADTGTREALAKLAVRREAHRERAAVLERALDTAPDDAFVNAELLLELARVWDESVGDAGAAESAYRRLLEVEPDNPDFALPAARALERIHLENMDHTALADDLRRQAQLEEDGETRASLLVRLGELRETTLGDMEGAIEAHRERLEIDPGDVAALQALERLYERQQQWQELIEVLQSRENVSDDDDERREIARRIGQVYEDKLRDADNAIVAYNDVLARFGNDRQTLAALARLYESTEKWEDLLEVLEADQELVEDARERAELQFRAAELMYQRTGELERAIETYQAVLEQEPEHGGALEALERIIHEVEGPERVAAARALIPRYEATQRYEPLVRALQVLGESEDDVAERLQSLRRAAEVAEVGLDDAGRAFELIGQAVRLAVSEDELPGLLDEHERLAEAAGRWQDYAGELREVAPDILDGELQTHAVMKAAETFRTLLDDRNAARELYQRVLENEPEHTGALDALDVLYSEVEDHAALQELLQRKLEINDDPSARVDLLLRQARLCEEKLEDADGAIDAFEQVLLEEERPEAYDALERLYAQRERWPDLISLLERRLDSGVGDPIEVRHRIGRARLEHMGEVEAALDEFREVLTQRRDHKETVRVLEGLMEYEEHRGAAAELLEPVYLLRLDWPKLTAALEARLSSEVELDTRKELLGRLGRLHEDYLEDLDAALEIYARLFREDPADEAVGEVLWRLARNLEEWGRLADIYGEVLEETSMDDESTARLAVTTGRLHEERTGDLERAASCYARALRFDPTDRAAFEALESVYRRRESWQPLEEVYREQVDVAEADADRVELLHKVAWLREDKQQDTDGAIQAYRDALEIDPQDEEAQKALDRLLSSRKRWDDLAEHLRQRIDAAAGTGEEIELKHRLGRLLSEQLDDQPGAIDLFEEVVQSDPAHRPTIDMLEKLVLDEEHRLRITQILEPIYRNADQWKKLIAVLEAQAEMSEEPGDRSRLLGEIGTLHEERGQDLERAFDAWARALAAEPAEAAPRQQVERLAERDRRWDQLVSAYEEAVQAAEEPTVRDELLQTLADVHEQRRGDPRSAIPLYERLLESQPDEPAPLDALDRLHTLLGDWQALAEVLSRKVDHVFDPFERAALLRRLGGVHEEMLEDVDSAIEAYQRASADDDTDTRALEALDRLYESADRIEDAAEIRQRRMELEQEPSARVELGLELGRLYEERLERLDDAIEVYQRVLEDEPGHAQALTKLGRLYERQEQWPELVDNLKERLERAEATTDEVELLRQMGNVLEYRLDDPAEAIEVYRQALDRDAAHEEAIQGLLRISKLEDHRLRASEVLEPLLHLQERWDELAALVESKVELASDPADKRDELKRLAEVHESGRGDAAAAFDVVVRSVAEDPEDMEGFDQLERLAAITGQWARLADVIDERASAVLDPQLGRELYVRLARIGSEHLDDEGRAIRAYEQALDQVGDDLDLLVELDRLYVKAERWNDLAGVIERRLGMEEDPERRLELLTRLGELRAAYFDDPRGAFATYQEVLEQNPREPRALEAMERLGEDPELAPDVIEVLENAYRDAGALEKVASLYDIRMRLAETDGERVRLLQEAGQMWEQELGRPEQALESLRRAVELDPRDAELLGEVERLAQVSGTWEPLRGLVETVSQRDEVEPDLKRDLNLRAAGWYRDHLDDAERAEACLRAALETDPEALEAYEHLVPLLRQPGREDDLVAALRAWAAADADAGAKMERLAEAARIAEGQNDLDTAAACREAMLELEPDAREVLDELIRLRERQEQWDELAGLLVRRVDLEDDVEARVSLRRRLAELYAGALQYPAKAIETYQQLLEDAPRDMEARQALETLFEQAERWEDLQELLQQRLELAETDEQRIGARVRLARLVEQAFDQRDRAIAQLREILHIDPNNDEANAELERLLAKEEQWDELVKLLQWRRERAASAGDSDAELGELRRIADIYEQRLGDTANAVATHEQILERIPEDEQALQAVARLQENAGNWEGVAGALERLLDILPADQAVETAHRVADLAEQELGDPARAEAALRRAFDIDPTSTHERLKSHHERHGQWAKLAMMLDAEQQQFEDEQARVDQLRRIADIHRDRLDDPATAASYLEKATEIRPDDRNVLLPLCDLYIEAGRQGDAVPVLEKIIESFGNKRTKEIAQYRHKLGQALEGQGEVDKALEQYDAAFKVDLTNVPILRDLGRLCHARGDYERAQKTFRALLLQKLDDGAGITKADVYYYLGDISAKQGDNAKAKSMLQRAIAEKKDHQGANELLQTL